MADKYLTEAEWKKFSKGRDVKDTALLKALAAYEKAKGPSEQLSALAQVEKETDALRKFVKGDKEFGAQLDAMDRAVGREEKVAKAAEKEAESKESEDEEDAPDLLTTKMIPLLRQVKNGQEMQALVALAGPKAAVMLSRRAISPSRRKMLTDYLDDGMPKFAAGICTFEAAAVTFVFQTQAAGMAKKLRAALLEQTALRLKVRVRGPDPQDVDEDGHEEEHEGTEVEVEVEVHEDQAAPSPLRAEYEQRLAATTAALKSHPEAAKLQALIAFAQGKAGAGQFPSALQALEQVDKLLAAQTSPTPTSTPTSTTTPQAPSGASLVKLQQARLGWEQARKKAQADMAEVARVLRDAVLAHNSDETAEDEYEEGDLQEGVKLLAQVFETLDTRLLDALDAALNAGPEQRPAHQAEAASVLTQYRTFMAASPLLAAIDGNPFRPCTVQRGLDNALAAVAAAL